MILLTYCAEVLLTANQPSPSVFIVYVEKLNLSVCLCWLVPGRASSRPIKLYIRNPLLVKKIQCLKLSDNMIIGQNRCK